MRIDYLLHHPHLIPEIAQLKFEQFHRFVPERPLEDFQKSLENHLNDKKLPIGFVALEGDEFLGTFCLREYDMETHRHLTPWVGGVLVHPLKWNRGIGTFLLTQAKHLAEELGYKHLYLFTTEKASWYARLGWEAIDHAVVHNFPVTIMKK